MLNRLRDVFASFQKHQVKYVVIGVIAAMLHGVPRATFNLDYLLQPRKITRNGYLTCFWMRM